MAGVHERALTSQLPRRRRHGDRTRGWGALTGNEVNLVGFGEPVRIGGTAVTANVRTGSRRVVGNLRGARARPSWSS